MIKTRRLLYVIGAYSGDVENNIKKAENVSINLIRNGFHVITPHKNTSGYEKYEDDNITYRTWTEMDINIMLRCDAVYVMNNWVNSEGSKNEIEIAKKNGMSIYCEAIYPSESFKFDW